MNGPPRRLHVGGEVRAGGAHFRVWAPPRRSVEVVIASGPAAGVHPLERGAGGHFEGFVAAAAAGDRYRYRLDGVDACPDPASRFQPDGPHGPSELVDPNAFDWTDHAWGGPDPASAVIYELHVGSFSATGDWPGAQRQLPYLAELGITVVELMPIAEFAGAFGWGYDGVDLFAPFHGYGRPDALRAFVDAAHGCGVAVILDVVCNHYGPDGNYLARFSDGYLGARSEWGDGPNFDGEQCSAVRALFEAQAGYWIDEYHFDGLRLDATQQIFDDSPEHILRAIVRHAHAAAAGRRLLVTAENEPQQAALVRPQSEGGAGCDALWNDDFHHSARVAATGRREAYFGDHRGTPQELLSALKHGFLFQGQHHAWQQQPRGTPARAMPARRFVHFLENHDQLANAMHGWHLHRLCDAGRLRALTAVLLLGPQVPLIFQGQEFAASAPFRFFADHHGTLADAVRAGRRAFLAQFPSLAASPVAHGDDHDPLSRCCFEACRLDHAERARAPHRHWLALHRDLLRLRRDDPVVAAEDTRVDGAVLDQRAWVLRMFAADGRSDRLLLVNVGADLQRASIAEPLLAPPPDRQWQQVWSSEAVEYGGSGAPRWAPARGGFLLAGSATLLAALPARSRRRSLVGYWIDRDATDDDASG